MISIAPRQQGSWDWRAAGNFICGGSGTGLLLFAAFAAFDGAPVVWLILPALALVGCGLGLVWLEIGRPWRFLHVYFNPQTSWMTREGIVALPLFAAGLAAVLFGHALLVLAAALFGLLFLYCQGRILQASKGIPSWREPMIVLLIVATGLAEGAGFLLLLAPVSGWAPGAMLVVFLLLLVLRYGVWLGYRGRLTAGGAPRETLAILTRTGRAFLWIGLVLPAVAGLAALAFDGGGVFLGGVAGVLAISGGWLLKFTLVTRAAQTQGFALERTPVRGAGPAGAGIQPGWD